MKQGGTEDTEALPLSSFLGPKQNEALCVGLQPGRAGRDGRDGLPAPELGKPLAEGADLPADPTRW